MGGTISLGLDDPRPLQDWLEAFFLLLEMGVEAQDRVQGFQFDVEKYRSRRTLWRHVKEGFGHFGQECFVTQLAYGNLQACPDGQMAVLAEPVIIRNVDTGDQLEFRGDEVEVVAHFIQFYRSLCHTADPCRFVRAQLQARGINKDNFLIHPDSPCDYIRNPFTDEDEDHADEREPHGDSEPLGGDLCGGGEASPA